MEWNVIWKKVYMVCKRLEVGSQALLIMYLLYYPKDNGETILKA